jgi:hypothetical protein
VGHPIKGVNIKSLDYTQSREKHLKSLLMLFKVQFKTYKNIEKTIGFYGDNANTNIGAELRRWKTDVIKKLEDSMKSGSRNRLCCTHRAQLCTK